jgi:shikimate kinase
MDKPEGKQTNGGKADSQLSENHVEDNQEKKRKSKLDLLPKLLPLITAIVAVSGFIFGIWQFNKGQELLTRQIISAETIAEKNIRAEEKQSREELLASKEREYLQKFWQERLRLYEEVTRATGQIASSDTLDDAKTSIGVFWKLYWGPLSILEDRVVLSAMVVYGEKLKKLEAKAQTEEIMLKELQSEAYDLARACRKSLEKTWKPLNLDDIDDFSLNPFRPNKN